MITSKSADILQSFLERYPDKSKIRYEAQIKKMLNTFNVSNVFALNIGHYTQLLALKSNGLGSTPFDYCNSFFKYLYAYNYLNDSTGFDQHFSIVKIRKDFEKTKRRSKSPKNEKARLFIPLEKIMKIEEYLSQDQIDIQFLKAAFLWHMLYHESFDIVTLRDIKAKTYDGEAIQIGTDKYEIPQRYRVIFEDLLNHPTRDGFDVNKIIKRLGARMDIPDLKPVDITQAQKQNKFLCCNCGQSFQNTIENWTSVNGKLMCIGCAEILKKNDNFVEQRILNQNISVFTIAENVQLCDEFISFDELTKKLPKQIDYLKLHEYQIQIGELGEKYVYEKELERLKNSKFIALIDPYKARVPQNGYDILSFDDGHEIYIEVKTTVKRSEPFIMSDTEKRTMESYLEVNKDYRIYRVENVRAERKEDIKCNIYKGEELRNLIFEPNDWIVKKSP